MGEKVIRLPKSTMDLWRSNKLAFLNLTGCAFGSSDGRMCRMGEVANIYDAMLYVRSLIYQMYSNRVFSGGIRVDVEATFNNMLDIVGCINPYDSNIEGDLQILEEVFEFFGFYSYRRFVGGGHTHEENVMVGETEYSTLVVEY